MSARLPPAISNRGTHEADRTRDDSQCQPHIVVARRGVASTVGMARQGFDLSQIAGDSFPAQRESLCGDLERGIARLERARNYRRTAARAPHNVPGHAAVSVRMRKGCQHSATGIGPPITSRVDHVLGPRPGRRNAVSYFAAWVTPCDGRNLDTALRLMLIHR